MTDKEYEHKKRECWEEYTTISPQYKAFSFAFDRAYALGKQEKDAEGEEMLTVSRKRVQEMYSHYDAISTDPDRPKDYIESIYEYADGVTIALDDLFGSKCLPDNVDSSEPNVESSEGDEEIAAKWSLKFADTLIAECEKGGIHD